MTVNQKKVCYNKSSITRVNGRKEGRKEEKERKKVQKVESKEKLIWKERNGKREKEKEKVTQRKKTDSQKVIVKRERERERERESLNSVVYLIITYVKIVHEFEFLKCLMLIFTKLGLNMAQLPQVAYSISYCLNGYPFNN